MKYLLMMATFLLGQLVVKSQDSLDVTSLLPQSKTFTARVWDTANMVMKAYLVRVNDSMIFLSPKPFPFNSELSKMGRLEPVKYQAIERIEIKRSKAVGRGLLKGFAGGALLGILTGLALGDDPEDQWFSSTATEKALALGLAGGLMGGVIGTIVGVVAKKTFIIGGSRASLQEMNRALFARIYK